MRKILQYILRFISKLVLKKYKPFVIAITGSAGKTSTKEAVFAVLNHNFPDKVRRSVENLNTEIGLPLTVIGGTPANRNVLRWLANIIKGLSMVVLPWRYPSFLILELAADKPGDIAWLTSFIKPDISIITAIGEMPVHLEFFSCRQAYIDEKAHVLSALKKGGRALLNIDDPLVRELKGRVMAGREVLFYGFDSKADVKAENISYRLPESSKDIAASAVNFKVLHKKDAGLFTMSGVLGEGAVQAALAASSVGVVLGIELARTAQSLKSFKAPKGRMTLRPGVKHTILLDDTYNASPISMELALSVLERFSDRRKIAVLGDMRELGANTEEAHRDLSRRAAKAADVVFLVGDAMIFGKEELGRQNIAADRFYWFDTVEKAQRVVQDTLRKGDVVLVKGSRAIGMEVIIEELVAI